MKKITIPKPCHENWNEMTPEEKGRHCQICNKTVLDFTKSSKEEIIDLVENSEENVCGRFNINQISKRNFPGRKVAATFLAATSLGAQQITAQEEIEIGDVQIVEEVQTNFNKIILSGKIKYTFEDKESINDALITVYTSAGRVIGQAQSTHEGYSIELQSGHIVNNHITVKVEKEGFAAKVVENIEITKEKMVLDVVMQEEIMLLGEVEVQHEQQENNCVKGKVKIE